MSCCITRRKLLSLAGTTLGAGVFLPNLWIRAQSPGPNSAGAVVGEPTAAKVGGEILARGGNAVDAAVAAALAAGGRDNATVVVVDVVGLAHDHPYDSEQQRLSLEQKLGALP